MQTFYFHTQLDGKLTEDTTGCTLPDEEAARTKAVGYAKDFIAKTSDVDRTYFGVEVNDGRRTRCIVRAWLVVERR